MIKINSKPKIYEGGQALLMLLFFVLVGITVATAATFAVAANSEAATTQSEGIIAKEMADSGIEVAMLGILRDNDNYTGETITDLNGGTTVVTVTGGSIKTIDSIATNGSFVKKVEVIVTYSNNVLGIPTYWKEIN
ncbi:MAG: hypothetical protein UU16_C0034G0006 [Candidatus Woesebacteria bacterium GW2011_GWA2_40_7]|uniref:Type 4 fimbrial biogenesis protein PilX N-terminal domain-containing protein n=3 Tax=Candidatus Woeseibacteriota TaxID=1752722 RepID=A0A0G0XWN9_9BACT|nr:MAG: hypothetical protein UT17_C0001G0121 [Candidatus Woesebacteria bacterium GW2011_GWB1_39_10]KKR72972.1 MAG: hypothetical protein UU16_C0034G0006 [Candidatus Woesebacteria bacterium GW2011_GWA2_40_7]KKR92307.1 MAG: hypothetical protein UU42_C0002G0121 [Candidatus Woesebacteria bacterium GW2011_GWA1_41_13b]